MGAPRVFVGTNPLRTFQLQLAIFWIATAGVAGGLFLAPIVGGAEPLGGQCAGTLWLGHQGSECLDLGRFWLLLLTVGLVGWLGLTYRALRPAIRDRQRSELASLFLYAAAAISAHGSGVTI